MLIEEDKLAKSILDVESRKSQWVKRPKLERNLSSGPVLGIISLFRGGFIHQCIQMKGSLSQNFCLAPSTQLLPEPPKSIRVSSDSSGGEEATNRDEP